MIIVFPDQCYTIWIHVFSLKKSNIILYWIYYSYNINQKDIHGHPKRFRMFFPQVFN